MERQERLTRQQRSVVQALLLAVELGDESAVSMLLADAVPHAEGTGRQARNAAAAAQAVMQGFLDGFGQLIEGLKGQIAVTQVSAPGFRFPVGQVTVRRRGKTATKDGHGDKSRRKQALA